VRNRDGKANLKKCLLVLFGKTGAGKSYAAEIFAQKFGFYLYDADWDLTAEMRQAITNGITFSDEMRDRYVEILRKKTAELLNSKSKVVLAQGLFKNKHRRILMEAFPFAVFVWVDADNRLIEERITERSGCVTLEYARRINPLFETPDFKCEKIINNGGAKELIHEISRIGAKIKGL
jgi:gluconokinase